MLDKLKNIYNKFLAVEQQLNDPNILSNQEKYAKINKEYKYLKKVADKRDEYIKFLNGLNEAKEIISSKEDDDMKEMAQEELEDYTKKIEVLEQELKFMLIPKSPEDAKNAVVEIRGGSGGDEASIFAGELYRLYTRFCEKKGWKIELVDFNEGTSGGYKEIIFNVLGDDVYGTLKYEAGVHRVQRVPQTETQGRVHTSAASVVVMPEAEEFDLKLDMNDIRKDLYCASGPGGQSVNTTYSAVRLTHLPTGIVAQCQDEKSQMKNYEKALKVLRSRIYEIELMKKLEEEGNVRKLMVSTGDRSAKIRTYNFPQGRISDHRIGLTLYNLSEVMNGEIDKLIEELVMADNNEKLSQSLN